MALKSQKNPLRVVKIDLKSTLERYEILLLRVKKNIKPIDLNNSTWQ
jgi:hypothetical protein